jgi:hypothetical protein
MSKQTAQFKNDVVSGKVIINPSFDYYEFVKNAYNCLPNYDHILLSFWKWDLRKFAKDKMLFDKIMSFK